MSFDAFNNNVGHASPTNKYGDKMLPPGKHRIAINFMGFREAEFKPIIYLNGVILESTTLPKGRRVGRGWKLGVNKWRDQDTICENQDFIRAVTNDLNITPERMQAEQSSWVQRPGVSTGQPVRGVIVDVEVTEHTARHSKKNGGQIKLRDDGSPVTFFAYKWTAVPGQTQETVAKTRAWLEASYPCDESGDEPGTRKPPQQSTASAVAAVAGNPPAQATPAPQVAPQVAPAPAPADGGLDLSFLK